VSAYAAYLRRLGWTVELAKERKANSMRYAREVKEGRGGHPSTKFLLVELARKYSAYIRVLSKP
jgi:hypothetical protein